MAARHCAQNFASLTRIPIYCRKPFVGKSLDLLEESFIHIKRVKRSLVCGPKNRTLQNDSVSCRPLFLGTCEDSSRKTTTNLRAISRFSTSTLERFQKIICTRAFNDSGRLQKNSCLVLVRNYVDDNTVRRKVDLISEKFAEARELLDDARESVGTVYFKDDMKEAQEAIEEVLREYENVLDSVSEKQKDEVVRSIGLKMQELRAQLNLLLEQIMH